MSHFLDTTSRELFQLDQLANQLIKEYRSSLGLETPTNRIDQGDLKKIIEALTKMGFLIIHRNSLAEIMKFNSENESKAGSA